MLKRVLVTGITGFAGSHLAEYLVKNKDYEVNGTYLNDESLKHVEEFKDNLNVIKIDLNDKEKVYELVNSIRPDLVFHLAALTSPGDSFKNPEQAILNNITAQLNLLEAIKDSKMDPTILIVSSADVYGVVLQSDLPINENVKFNPTNPYAVSKITQDFLGLQYFNSYKLKIIRVRPFNHIGPKQSPHFVVSAFAKTIAEIEKGEKDPILKVGNLDSKRDFTDVRDIVIGYCDLLEKGRAGDVYNIGSGVSYKIEDILNKLLSFSHSKITVENDPELMRPSDNPELVCNNNKIKNIIGWQPKIKIEQTLKDTLDYWRKIV